MMLYYLYKFAEFLVDTLPHKTGYWLARRIADIKYYTSIKDKRILINNLRPVIGDDEKRLRYLTREIFRNFCMYLVDFLRQPRLNKQNLDKFVKVRGIENLEAAFKKGKGVILVSAHLGNWELGAAVTSLLGFPLNIIALRHKDNRVNTFFDNRRLHAGSKVIPLGGSIKKVFLALEKNEGIAILADRDFSKSDLVVKFFGRDTIMPKGVGIFKLRKDCELVPCFPTRNAGMNYDFVFEKAIKYNKTGNEARDLKGIVEATLKVIETYIVKYPEQWFMFSELWPR